MEIARSETVEKDLDGLITRRHEKRKATEGERAVEEMWAESERRHTAQRRAENRMAWTEHHERMYRVHARLAAEHAARAVGLTEETDERRTA